MHYALVNAVKQSESVQICGDFKRLNKFMVVDQHPIPHLSDIFTVLVGGQKFSKLDLSDAYNQLELDSESQKNLVINTHKGLFKFRRLPVGVSSAPAIFQRVMNKMLKNLKKTANFFDDILVTGSDDEEHLKNLSEVFKRIRDHGLRLKEDKCSFFQPSVQYLGHVIDKDGIRPSEEKIKAIQDMLIPTNQAELPSFLGMVTYFLSIFPSLSDHTVPLNYLLRKDVSWVWSSEVAGSFNTILKELTSLQVLAMYNQDQPLFLACDASEKGLEACISQHNAEGQEQVIEHASKSLTKADVNYSQIETETLSIIYGIQKFRHYLLRRHFTLRTDHRPPVPVFGATRISVPTRTSSRLTRWALQLLQYKYDNKSQSSWKR